MPSTFEYITQPRKDGPFIKKELVAETIKAAEARLRDMGIPILSINKKIKRGKSVKQMGLNDLTQFAGQMKTTTVMQMPIVEALKLSRETSASPAAAKIITELITHVDSGMLLADAMRKTGAFSELTLGLIHSGESSGTLDKTFLQLKQLSERSRLVRSKIRSAMIYPLIVLLVATGCVYLMMLKAVPTFVNMFAQANVALPTPTIWLIKISKAISAYPIEILIGLGGVFYGLVCLPSMYRANPWCHKYVLEIWGLSPVMKKMIQATFTRTFATMVGSRTSRIVDTLGHCRLVSTNYVYKGVLARAIMAVNKGKPLGTAFEGEEKLFGKPLVKQIIFAEQAGEMEEILTPMADALDDELMELVNNLKTVIEPAMIVVIASVVGFILLALLLPTMNMSSLVK